MPPKKFSEASFFLIDLHSKNLPELKRTASKIIAYKSLIKSKTVKNQDVLKLGLVGSQTNNCLNYQNINVITDWQYYLLDVIKDIHQYDVELPGNIFEAIHLAAHSLENESMVSSNQPKSIVLFTDLTTQPSTTPQDLAKLKKFLKISDILLFVIGPSVKIPRLVSYEDVMIWSHSVEPHDPSISHNINSMKTILHEGVITDIATGPHLFLYYKPLLKPPFPWYCDMMIGNKISYKINLIKLLSDSGTLKYPNESKPPATFNYINIDNGNVVDDPIPGYLIQGEVVVLSAEKEKMINEQQRMNEDKCFELSFFVDRSAVSSLYFEGDTISTILADGRTSEKWQDALDVMSVAMDKMNVVAFVKRVYAKGPQYSGMPYVLFTCSEHGPTCLLASKWPVEKDIVCTDAADKKKEKGLKTGDSEVRSRTRDYLSSLVIDDEYCDDGRVLYCLPESMQVEPNTMNQVDFYVECLLKNNFKVYNPEEMMDLKEEASIETKKKTNEKPGRLVNELMMHPVLKERSNKSLLKLNELCKTQTDEPQQCATS